MKRREQSRRQRRLVSIIVGGIALVVVLGAVGVFLALGAGLGGIRVPLSTPSQPQVLKNSTYINAFTSQVAQGLRLSVVQIKVQKSQGKTMPEIATAQKISMAQLHTIEFKAFQDILNKEVQSGDTTQQNADQTMQQLRQNSTLLDVRTLSLFSGSNSYG